MTTETATIARLADKLAAKRANTVKCPVREIAAELRRVAKYHGTNVALSNDGEWSGCEDDWSVDVRLQISEGGAWNVYYGDASYDTDHRGVWGSDSIVCYRGRDGHLRVGSFDSLAMARGLWNQAVDMAVDGFDGQNLAYAR